MSSQINFLTEIFRDPGSLFLPFAPLKQKHHCALDKSTKSCVGRMFVSFVHLEGFSSNQLYEYFEELVSFYREMKDGTPEQAGLDAAA